LEKVLNLSCQGVAQLGIYDFFFHLVKDLIENSNNSVINRRNGCGSKLALKRADFVHTAGFKNCL